MKFFLALLVSFSASAYELDRSALDNSEVAFIPHTIPKPYQSYVSYEIAYPPVKELLEELKKTTGPLTDRGEAHITVITPPEFDRVLSKVLKIEEINELVLAENIQRATYEPVCIGSGSKDDRKTYYVVVRSPELLRLREAVHKLYLEKNGKEIFDPGNYYPHITLGYINGDVHEDDGLKKNDKTCLPDSEVEVR